MIYDERSRRASIFSGISDLVKKIRICEMDISVRVSFLVFFFAHLVFSQNVKMSVDSSPR